MFVSEAKWVAKNRSMNQKVIYVIRTSEHFWQFAELYVKTAVYRVNSVEPLCFTPPCPKHLSTTMFVAGVKILKENNENRDVFIS